MPSFISNTVQIHIARFDLDLKVYKHLVLKRAGHLKVYPNLWQVVTGKIEAGETAIQTMLREVLEETSIIPLNVWTLPYVSVFFDAFRDAIMNSPVFGILIEPEQEIKLSVEHQDYEWLELEECIERLELPSHREGSKIFNDYVLAKNDKFMFKLKF